MRRFLTCLLMLLVVPAGALAQSDASTGEIRGRVFDASGALIPDSQIEVTNQETGISAYTVSNDVGQYRMLLLRPGSYGVRVQADGFAPQLKRPVLVTVGQALIVDFALEVGALETLVIDVTETLPLAEPDRSQQATTIHEEQIRALPIDRRDYLTYTLLAPGVSDSDALADTTDYRIVQNSHSGIFFFGNNGRGNSVSVDGGEANDSGGGVRPMLSQEAVREFQINRSNFSAEMGGASGGVINVVSKSGTNFLHGSAYGFFRHDGMDAADPFALDIVDGTLQRVDPESNRQQFGFTLGGPMAANRTFFFAAFEGLERDESTSVAVLNDPSIFEPTPTQEAILGALPAPAAAALRPALTSPPSTRELFEVNSGVFPFRGRDYKVSFRLDHQLNTSNQLMLRYNNANVNETNPNTRALIGVSRGVETSRLDHVGIIDLSTTLSPSTVNQLRLQFNYGDFLVNTREKFGPELNIAGFGFFNRDIVLPSNSIWRRYEASDNVTLSRGSHLIKMGGVALVRGNHVESQTVFSGRFNFGELPGGLIHPVFASTTINAIQAFNLGLPQAYQQGFGDPIVSSTEVLLGLYFQDSWQVGPSLTVDIGLRYELDDLRDPIRTDKNNFAPRFGFAWDPSGIRKTTVRGGYGIFYAPTNYALVHVANSLGEIEGVRPIAQVLTTIQTPGAASAANIYQTLRAQGVITLPSPTQSITPSDLEQFGIAIAHTGPRPPLSVLFRTSDDFASSYTQQGSLGIEREITPDVLVAANYLFARGLKILRARDDNLLNAPVDPNLGIRVWNPLYFKDPLLLQDNVYESTGRSFYHGLTVEVRKRFANSFSLNTNYTFSKAIDEVVDFNTDFQAMDQMDLRAERALSAFDQRHKFVLYGSVETPIVDVHPIVRASSGRPFNLLAGFDLNQDRHSTTDRPAFAGRNTGRGPNFWTVDLRLTRRIQFDDRYELELMGEAFNVFNRLNYRSVNNTVGNISGPFDLKGIEGVSPSTPLGFTSALDPRRVQLGVRLTF